MNQIISMKNVGKQYIIGEITIDALKDVSFTIDEGEFVIILGASGAGKTTLLNILGGMDSATSGNVMVGGENIRLYNDNQLTRYRRDKVGFVFQFYNLISNLNAFENVEFAAEVCKNHLDPREVLARVGLAERAQNFPPQLSGGEQQRVAIARAVAKNPLLLLCDEPTGALDYQTGKKVLSLLAEVNMTYHKTIVLITHNSLLSPIADKVIRVKSGQIESIEINPHRMDVKELEW
ncbi:ABC transporter ATP-binding protein [Anaerocolumna chitinilytica]|uniref:ABC transporter ATP-binding protein n=1 Tax=Anaerocolumna chitinilytica TaxID=1727145 RepID=A0A7I8DP92_9FIRM|nr:ABC transporter ATP-binding protein [Anaerocolumna chitinilytica]BCJ99124.1 ABC transporter ATP-binding protein [Anaerocolumna chitinilytica]